MDNLSDYLIRKYTNVFDASDWEIETDTGWEPLFDVKQTEEYEVYELYLENGMFLRCADDHIVFLSDYSEMFVKDLLPGNEIITNVGISEVLYVKSLAYSENMYDVGVNSENHRFYSNGILSHNSTIASAYLLWYAMFVPDSLVLIASNKHDGALEIMQRVRFAYENIPNHIRAGVVSYNKKSIEFDNGSRIISQTTTENTGRGLSISLIYLDEFAFVRPNIADALWTSLSPTLATGGKCIITSTPNTDEDRFAKIWFEANNTFDEYGNETEIGRNGFRSFLAIWSAHPDRDEKWAKEEESSIGSHRFLQEHECIGADSIITLLDTITSNEFKTTIEKYYLSLSGTELHVTTTGKKFYKNNNFKVLTPTGFETFSGVSLMGTKDVYQVITNSNKLLECTYDHKLFLDTSRDYMLPLSDLSIGDSIETVNGTEVITNIIKLSKKEPVYDLIEVSNGHRYYANGILSSNCQFVGSEETLLDQIMLSNMKGIDPITKSIKHVRWYKEIDPQMTYLVSLDPAVGTGGDNAAIQVLELPSLIQVAEWQHNKTPVEGQIGILKHITSELSKTGAEDIFWSVENNTLGEAALVVIRDVGEDNIPGMFLSDPDMRKTKGVRKGFSTSNRKKLEACIKFKRLVETNKLTILSKNLVSELKTFISSDGSYKAKSGCKDDLVTAMLMAIRMADLIAKWDPTLQEVLNSNIGQFDEDEEDDDDYGDSPMPMAFL